MSRKKELKDEYLELLRKNKIVTEKDNKRMKEIVEEWKEIILNE